ncbi:glycosyltransferase [Acidisoma silvae]|uniref:Glycosyltransferase n=1 Tax=Acidisoma silvae TaxID=2802396 RepID=A0A963YW66_9PROT|nr:glycosyltransferase [Acidisoma silvae]
MTFFAAKTARAVIAIPAKNEAELIHACLASLARQSEPADDIVLLVNNTTDCTAEIAHSLAASLRSRLHVHEVTLSHEHANAGTMRRFAMEKAAELAGPQGAILTTDADGQLPFDWVARNLAWLRAGYDAVCGRAVIDPADETLIPVHLLQDDWAETQYTALLDEIDHWVDPRPWDPWPRHTHRSGASIAVRSAVYAAVGGLPHVSHSEDRGFVARLEHRDCKIRHDTEITVTVSGRHSGRARGGMAEAIARRIIKQDEWADDRLEMPQAALRRAELRCRARAVWQSPVHGLPSLASMLMLPPAQVERFMRSPWFGGAWADIESVSPVLRRMPIPMAALRDAIMEAKPILNQLRKTAVPSGTRLSRDPGLQALAE